MSIEHLETPRIKRHVLNLEKAANQTNKNVLEFYDNGDSSNAYKINDSNASEKVHLT